MEVEDVMRRHPDPLAVLDRNGALVSWSAGFADIIGTVRAGESFVERLQVWTRAETPNATADRRPAAGFAEAPVGFLAGGSGEGATHVPEPEPEIEPPDGGGPLFDAVRALLAGRTDRARGDLRIGFETRQTVWHVDVTRCGPDGGLFVKLDDVTGARREEARAKLAGSTDSMTNLGNRRGLTGDLDRHSAEGRHEGAVLATMDIVSFRRANVLHGHDFGDRLLCHFAGLLRHEALRVKSKAYRLGGDEFALLVAPGDMGLCRAILDNVAAKFAVIVRPLRNREPSHAPVLRAAATEISFPLQDCAADLIWAADCKRAVNRFEVGTLDLRAPKPRIYAVK